MAAVFYGRDRGTDNTDVYIKNSTDNIKRLLEALGDINYPIEDVEEHDFKKYEEIQIRGETIVNIITGYDDLTYENLEKNRHYYGKVEVKVVGKKDILKILEKTGINSEDIEVLRLLDEPVKNKDEINRRQ